MVSSRLISIIRENDEKEENAATGFLCASCLTGDHFLHESAIKNNFMRCRICAGCGNKIDKGLTLNYIANKINEHLSKHYMLVEPQDDVDNLVTLQTIIQRFVSNNNDVIQMIYGILYQLNSDKFKHGRIYKDLLDQNAINEQTAAIVDEWERYSFELKHVMRFTNNKAIDFYKDVISYGIYPNGNNKNNNSPMLQVIETGTVIYRGRRVSDDEHREKLKNNNRDFYAPPPEKAANSRMSPPGMPFLYTATNPKTCIAELHPFAGDEIALVELETERTLYFFDLTRAVDVKHGLPGLIYDPAAKVYARRHLLSRLHDLIAQPFRATDISYTAIQAFAESVRNYEFFYENTKRKFDGLIFESTQMKNGMNYVFFGDNTTEHRKESPFENYGVKPSKTSPVRFYRIHNIQVITTPTILDE